MRGRRWLAYDLARSVGAVGVGVGVRAHSLVGAYTRSIPSIHPSHPSRPPMTGSWALCVVASGDTQRFAVARGRLRSLLQ